VKVVADRDICIGAGMCVMTTDAVFDQDDEGIVVVLPGLMISGLVHATTRRDKSGNT